MPDESIVAASICDSIIQGTYPQSEDLLTSDLTSKLIPSLLTELTNSKRQISDEIRDTSKGEAGDVDQWILQAKKAQQDIARCKLESQKIVEEHQFLQTLRAQATDYQRKVDLLEAEIDFTEKLKHEFDQIALATKSLKDVELYLLEDDLFKAAGKLHQLEGRLPTLARSRSSRLICDLKDELQLKTRVKLEGRLNSQIQIKRDPQQIALEVLPTEPDNNATNSDTIISGLRQIGEPQEILDGLTDKLRSFILHPLRQSTRMKMSAYKVEPYNITVQLGTDAPSFELVFDFVSDLIRFLQSSISKTVCGAVVSAIFPELMSLLVSDWLTPRLPTELSMLDQLDEILRHVHRVQEQLRSLDWQGQTELNHWRESLNRSWLNKRKAATLDAVRKSLAASKGILRQVERIETQVVPMETGEVDEATDNWDASWDEDANEQPESAHTSNSALDEDDASGWGFDDEDDNHDKAKDEKGPANHTDEEDADAAWGWNDEDPQEPDPVSESQTTRAKTNGSKKTKIIDQEQTLSEWYSISEVPDHMIDIISRELSDLETLQGIQHSSLDTSMLSRGLFALPTLALAMFRATAPSYYGASPSLTDIHRYNDSLYIAEQLRKLTTNPLGTATIPNLDADIKAMEKFARLAYSKEMETQRLIVWDLLEGAQGFTSCTQFPYSQEIDTAVSSVVDRIRTLHGEWAPVLGTSHLMQSIGSILSMVVGKVISSIDDMDDISEPESQRLTSLCQQIATLDDLFPHQDDISTTPVYVPAWFRFQYLIQILDSSLVDIRFLWTEGELSLEFTQREVVSFIQALFAESRHRRDAINAVMAKKGPWDQ